MEPDRAAEGERDAAALDHYANVIAALRRRGLEPVVTLHHFTNPAWFSESGGWLRRDAPLCSPAMWSASATVWRRRCATG